MVAWARQNTPLVGRTDTESFVDYWTAANGSNASKRDWTAAWRNWMRKAQRDAERDAQPRRSRAAAGGPAHGGYASATDANIAAFLGGGNTTGRLALTEGKP